MPDHIGRENIMITLMKFILANYHKHLTIMKINKEQKMDV